jgi:hypothetical protein
MQEPVRLALVSHALVLDATPTAVIGAEARQQLQAALARLVAAAEAAEGGCEWLQGHCDFLQRRHRLGGAEGQAGWASEAIRIRQLGLLVESENDSDDEGQQEEEGGEGGGEQGAGAVAGTQAEGTDGN